MNHSLACRVWYEDTDMAGIVYYANYLKFIERARSDWVCALGIDQRRLKTERGIVFAVRRVEADYLAPAFLGDTLEVSCEPVSATPARALLRQEVRRGEDRLFAAFVTIVALGDAGRPVRLPAEIRLACEPGGE
ncbi:MAG: tol-pal system-associated acyl-CoA thioesterase [Alphaproteobacteria bacterium HGW-Alphaproteobacteria-2]|nr:MAG: tol-pal system-associated acyl-CoA thioesterase [Alphaproteobacteria bacterium HGW-Alphaproteobacteria-2]